MPPLLAPLGLNRNGYRGESVDAARVLRDLRQIACAKGWQVEAFGQSGPFDLLALHRPASPAPASPESPPGASQIGVPPGTRICNRYYLSAGIHGDEPAGPAAILELLRRDAWPSASEVWICPCLNPAGLAGSSREGPSGKDLNRDYRSLREPETRAHAAWLDGLPRFDLALCLHEDWEARGFYLYELNPNGFPSPAEAVLDAVRQVCPIDPSATIDGRAACGGIIRPDFNPDERPDWPEAFYLAQNKSPRGYTFEAPSDFPLPVRIEALAAAVQAVLGQSAREGRAARRPDPVPAPHRDHAE